MKTIEIENIPICISEDFEFGIDCGEYTIFDNKIWHIETQGLNRILLTRHKQREKITLPLSYRYILPKIWMPCDFPHIEDHTVHYYELIESNNVESIYYDKDYKEDYNEII